ncbi:MAG: hypothetical protein CMP23_01930 [Rickettsiales bacterium]|nr:hypothetical protein [Rickettsiales bacterium]
MDVDAREVQIMKKCPGCAAPVDPSSLVCSFCGLPCQDIVSAADELRALQELHQASQEMARGGALSGLFGGIGSNMMNNLGMGPQARIARFWQNAFIPRSIDAQCQAVIQMLSMIVVPDGMMQAMQDSMNPTTGKAHSIYFDRAEAVLSAMRIHHAGDPKAAQQVAALEAELIKERGKVRAARRRGWLLYGMLLGGSLAFLGGAALLLLLFS